MRLQIILDFDGVLFNSAYEAYQVCEAAFKGDQRYRKSVHFDEFMEFRAVLTDAWQFNRLYKKDRLLKDFSQLPNLVPDDDDWFFTQEFFATRETLMENADWAKLMSPYPFFYQIKDLINRFPDLFKILSTRNEKSIKRTLDFFGVADIEINGQASIRKHGSKIEVAKNHGWLNDRIYTVYIDDMNTHLEPFQGQVDLCVHAGWGYDTSGYESYTGTQTYSLLKSLLSLVIDKKF